jgi:energy-coupling factor transport system substrate-specific component
MNQAIKAAKPSMWAWRTVDLVTLAVMAAALGVAFWGFDVFVYPVTSTIGNIYPPFSELQLGVWILPAVIGALIVRKPGAALYTELIAATLETILGGNPWSWTNLVSGAAQAAGVEIVLALFAWRVFTPWIAALGAALSGVFEVLYEYVAWVPEYTVSQKLVYLGCGVFSAAVIAGIGGWYLVRLLAGTGALGAFAVGREARSGLAAKSK